MSMGQKIAITLVFGSLMLVMVFNSYTSGMWSPLVSVLAAFIPIVIWARWVSRRTAVWSAENQQPATPRELIVLMGGLKTFICVVAASSFMGIGVIVVSYVLFGT